MKAIRYVSVLTALTCFATPAWAVTSTTVVITQDQQPVAQARISLFNAETGTQVQPQDDDDDSTALFLLDDGRYRVQVDGKDVETFAVDGTGSRTVRVTVPPASVFASIPARPGYAASPSRGFTSRIRIGGDFAHTDLPRMGAGVIIEPGNERYAVSNDQADGFAIAALFRIPLTSESGLVFEGRLGRADDEVQTTIASGSTPVGIVYHDRAPSGSTGTALGATGLDAILARDSEYEWFGAGYEKRVAGGDGSGPEVTLGLGLSYSKHRDKIDALVSSAAYPGITSESSQQIDTSNIGVHFDLGLESPFDYERDSGLFWFGDTRVGAVHRDSEFESTQHNLCNLCGVADRDFTITRTGDDKRWGLEAGLSAGFGYRFGGGAALALHAGVNYSTNVPGILNPETGDDLFVHDRPTQIGREGHNLLSYGFGVSFTIYWD